MTDLSTEKKAIKLEELFSIKGKVALVTGGSRGIGYMIAQGYVEAGVRVYICSRKKEACDQAAEELSTWGTCISIPADVSTLEGINGLRDKISQMEPSLHILVNNAGATWGAPIAEYPEINFKKVMELNVNTIFFLTREMLPLLEKAAQPDDPARVINIGSVDGLMVPMFESYAYSASKAAVHHLTRVLAVNLASKGITVNAVAPGPFESKMAKWMLDNFQDKLIENSLIKRIGRPSDIAGIAIYLASRAASYITGTVTPIDGGLSIPKLGY